MVVGTITILAPPARALDVGREPLHAKEREEKGKKRKEKNRTRAKVQDKSSQRSFKI